MYLNLYNYKTDMIFINRVIDNKIENSFMEKWKNIQSKYIKELEEVFTGIPIVKIPLYPKEILGISAIKILCETIKKSSKNLFDTKVNVAHEEYIKCEDGYILKIYLPQAKEENIKIFVHNTDLNIKLNNFNRCIPLPNILRRSEITCKKFEEGILSVHFKVLEKRVEEKE